MKWEEKMKEFGPLTDNLNGTFSYNCICGTSKTIKQNYIRELVFKRRTGLCHPCGRERMKKTLLDRYKVDHISKVPEFRKKAVDTCVKNHGVQYPTQNAEVRQKVVNTCVERYNVKYALQDPNIRAKINETNKEKYGGHPMFSEEVKEKIRNTCKLKYGFENPMQNPEIFEKQQIAGFKLRPFTFPSGRIALTRGYEPYALSDLLKEGFHEDQLFTSQKDMHNLHMPELWYTFEEGPHLYNPDIYIPSQNLIIEVKSFRTLSSELSRNIEKMKAVLNNNLKFELRVYDDKGILTNKMNKIEEIINYKPPR